MSEIEITIEKENNGSWLRIHIPYPTGEKTTAYIQNIHGDTIRRVTLNEGNNAIDICNINDKVVDVKIETPYEIILRKIKITD